MRDSFNFNMIPIVQDNVQFLARGLTNISSNGYYGYQPPLLSKRAQTEDTHVGARCPETGGFMDMEVQFESLARDQNINNRKRRWEYANDHYEFKKRRQNGKYCYFFK